MSELKLSGKIAFVTGSSSGIGKAVALLFAKNGANVIISSHKNKEEGEQALKELNKIGGNHFHVNCDLGNRKEVEKIFDEIKKKYGKLDILINNAGFSSPLKTLQATTEDSFDEVISSNVKSVVWCSQFATPLMQEKGWIINTSSIRGLEYSGRAIAYSAAKAAVNSLTKTMALELAPKIFVNAVLPGSVSNTKIYDSRKPGANEEFDKKLPLKRAISAEEIAESYLFLATQKYLTGTLLLADGGLTILENWIN